MDVQASKLRKEMSELMSEPFSEEDKLFYETFYKNKRIDMKEGNLLYEEYYYENCYDEKSYIRFYYKNRQRIEINGDITMQELKAINKKCEELGWI